MRLPGTLHLAIVRSSVAHGRIRRIDPSRALALPGVVTAILPQDLAPIPRIPVMAGPLPQLDPWLQPVLADGQVRYVGQPVAAVVAEDPYIAEDAAELVVVEVEPLPPVAPTEPTWDDAPVLLEVEGRDGPVEEVFASAAHVLHDEFHVARRTGSPIETRGLLAHWRADDGVLEVWGSTKVVWFARQVLSSALAIPPERVICHRIDVGGMFGTRGELYPEDVIVARASKALERPVKWIEDRREHLLAINQSPEELHRFALALGADGELLAYRDEVTLDVGAYARPIGARLPALIIENLPGPYRWQATAARISCRLTTKPPVGTVRAPTRLGSNFVRERAIDLAAHHLGIDAVQLRQRNLLRPKQLPYRRTVAAGETLVYEGGDYPAMLSDLLDRAGHAELLREVAARRDAGEAVGIGVAAFLEGSGKGLSEGASATVDTAGRFRVLTTASEVGQGLDATLRLVASERLGVAPDRIAVDSGSTFAPGTGRGTYGSRSTVFAGSAVDAACRRLLDALAARAAARLGRPVRRLDLREDGAWHGRSRLDWQDLAPAAAEAEWHADGPTFGFGVHLVVARVDRDTGVPTLERVVVGYDCGRVLRADAVHGQLVGGTVHGLAATLFERLDFGDAAQPRSVSFLDYVLPTCADVPSVDVVTWESPIAGNPLGVRGVGEAGTAGVSAAVANAVAAAMGGDGLRRIPVLPAHVVAADQ